MKFATLALWFFMFMVLTVLPAAASRHSRRHAVEQPASTSISRSQPDVLCEGGMLVTADDQIRGCTTLIGRKLSREKKAIAFYNRGNALMKKTRVADAIADFSSALSLNAQYAQALFNRAIAYQVISDRPAAFRDVNAYLLLEPTDADALALRGAMYLAQNKPELAEPDLDKALARNPAQPSALLTRGHVRLRAQRFAEALADYEAALQLNPENAEALYGRGVARIASGNRKDGEADLASAEMVEQGVGSRVAAFGVIASAPASP